MKWDREMVAMVAVLVGVAIVATVLLGLTHLATRDAIVAAQKRALHAALVQVLPEHANDPQQEAVRIADGDEQMTVYPARDASGRLVGLAWEQVAPDGYNGSIRILIGVHPDGRIAAIRVTDHKETPGLGDGIVKNRAWLDSFRGRALAGTRWAVRKDGGDFDQFTGATITPRAVVKAVRRGLEFFERHRKDWQAMEQREAAHD